MKKIVSILFLDKDDYLNFKKIAILVVVILVGIGIWSLHPIDRLSNTAGHISSWFKSDEKPAAPRPPIPSEVANAKTAATPEQLDIIRRSFEQELAEKFKTTDMESAWKKFQDTATENVELKTKLEEANAKVVGWKSPEFVSGLQKNAEDAVNEAKKARAERDEAKVQLAKYEEQKNLEATKLPPDQPATTVVTDPEAAKAAQLEAASGTTSAKQEPDKNFVADRPERTDRPVRQAEVSPSSSSGKLKQRPTLEERRQEARERNSPRSSSGIPETASPGATSADDWSKVTPSQRQQRLQRIYTAMSRGEHLKMYHDSKGTTVRVEGDPLDQAVPTEVLEANMPRAAHPPRHTAEQ